VVLGVAGTLPVAESRSVLEYAVKAALALNCRWRSHSKFDRQAQYFYPDLPRNYQISQVRSAESPKTAGSRLEVAEKGKGTPNLKTIGIERLHMEEDAGKLVHAGIGSSWPGKPTHSLGGFTTAPCGPSRGCFKPDLRTGREGGRIYAQKSPNHAVIWASATAHAGKDPCAAM